MNRESFPRAFAICLFILLLFDFMHVMPAHAETAEQPRVTVYFPNWNVYADDQNQVKNLPWDGLDGINHAFWKIVPQDGGFAIASTDPWADTDADNPKAHFPQYAEFAQKYPQTKILLCSYQCSDCFGCIYCCICGFDRGDFQ